MEKFAAGVCGSVLGVIGGVFLGFFLNRVNHGDPNGEDLMAWVPIGMLIGLISGLILGVWLVSLGGRSTK